MSDSNKPAFPRPASEFKASGSLADGDDAIGPQSGMTLLEYYAGQALVGISASTTTSEDIWTREGIAQECVRRAKALILELNEHENP